MLTDTYTLEYSLADIEQALKLTEKCAVYCELSGKQALQLRLLTEELMGMMHGILGGYISELYLSSQGKDISIHLKAHADMDISAQEREALVAASTKGENLAYKGFMGNIRRLFESVVLGGEDCLEAAGHLSFTGIDCGADMLPDEWSLRRYTQALEKAKGEAQPVWDELERSIVAKLADDVRVSVHADIAELVIQKNFEPKSI